MKQFKITWTLYNPVLKKAVECVNTDILEAETLEDAWKKLQLTEYPRPMGLECIGLRVEEMDVDVQNFDQGDGILWASRT